MVNQLSTFTQILLKNYSRNFFRENIPYAKWPKQTYFGKEAAFPKDDFENDSVLATDEATRLNSYFFHVN